MSSSYSSVAVAKICFNYRCMEALSNPPPGRRTGWRLRCGEMAQLCDRCSCAFEQGNFCETFHSDDGGWRNCETCGKRVHCGCIVSLPTYVFLDAGGIDCVACARKSVLAATNQMSWPMFMPQQVSAPGKSWKPASGSFYGQLRQAPHTWNMTSTQSDLQQRLSFEFDRPNSIEKLTSGGRYSIFNNEKKFKNLSGRSTGGLDNVLRERYAKRKVVLDPASAYGTFQEGNIDGQKDSCHLVGANDSISTRKTVNADPCSTRLPGTNIEAHPNSCVNSLLPSAKKEETSSLGLVSPFQLMNGSKELMGFLANQSHNQAGPPLSKQSYSQYVIDEDLQTQTRNGKPRADNRAQSHLLPRYWPKISDQELQQKSGDSNYMITPLFEKMLSASDAGRIGRLVLPKKCAEAYFPTISQPEGLPLKVQDPNGKDWVFQFRFWPNNNSRMYVLEGVTPCIQAMQLQAGDTVTFSRIDPVGKLLMGFRKASSVSAEQDSRTVKSSNGFSAIQGGETKATDVKGITEARDLINTAGQQNCTKFLDDGLLRKVGLGARSSQGTSRRKSGNLGTKNKRLRIETEDSMELKITWEEAQQLLRPPPNCLPSVVLVEGHEFEEYEEAPVLGKPAYFTKAGYSCSAAQEMSLEQHAELIPCKAGASKRSKVKVEIVKFEDSDGLDTLANLAILGEDDKLLPPFQPTTKHPRHRLGCTCIVCIQPPSGKGPKHKQTCACNVCLTVKRRFRTLMLRREKRASEKEAETLRKQQKPQLSSSPEKLLVVTEPSTNTQGVYNSPKNAHLNDEGSSDEGLQCNRVTPSSLKTQIDLNIQPEREEEPSPKSDTRSMMRLVQDAAA